MGECHMGECHMGECFSACAGGDQRMPDFVTLC